MPIISKNIKEVPDIDGIKYIKYTRTTSVNNSSGEFYLTFPEHLKEIAKSVYRQWGEHHRPIPYDDRNNRIYAKTLEEANTNWGNLIVRCIDFIKTTTREKVILINVSMKVFLKGDDGYCILSRDNISFCDVSPTLGINYEICYKIGERLFDEDNHYIRGELSSDRESHSAVVPYTKEREEFLVSLVKSIENAALKINNFLEGIQKDPLAIDTEIKKALPEFIPRRKNIT